MQNSGHKKLIATEMNLDNVKYVGGQGFKNSPQKNLMSENEMKSLINQHHMGATPQTAAAQKETSYDGKAVISERQTRGTTSGYASNSTNQGKSKMNMSSEASNNNQNMINMSGMPPVDKNG